MTEDSGTTPSPRPRRRRTDRDPSYKPPKVARERRRSAQAAPPSTDEPTAAHAPESAEPVAAEPVATPAPSTSRSRLPMIEDRSPDPAVCPFLRSTVDDRLAAPIEAPDPANRCAALDEAVPQSLRQQEIVCLTSGHVNCPRYLRGAAAVTAAAPTGVRAGRVVSPSIAASIAFLVVAFALSVVFVLSRGGLELTPAASASPSADAAVSPTPTTATTPAPSPSLSAEPTAEPTATPASTATPAPTPSASPAPTPTPTQGAAPTSDRYQLLAPCPDAPDCWIYTVRSGDNVVSIANYFGVPLQSVYDRNPWLQSQGLRAGQELRLPPPTR